MCIEMNSSFQQFQQAVGRQVTLTETLTATITTTVFTSTVTEEGKEVVTTPTVFTLETVEEIAIATDTVVVEAKETSTIRETSTISEISTVEVTEGISIFPTTLDDTSIFIISVVCVMLMIGTMVLIPLLASVPLIKPEENKPSYGPIDNIYGEEHKEPGYKSSTRRRKRSNVYMTDGLGIIPLHQILLSRLENIYSRISG